MLLTTNGVLDLNGDTVDSPFEGMLVHHGQLDQNQPVVIVDRHEIWKKNGAWKQLTTSDLKLNCLLVAAPDNYLIGTEEARIIKLSGDSRFLTGFDEIENREDWWTPWGGPADVRSLAKSPDGTIYANIHVGWIARSNDVGESWTPLTEGLHEDVHQVQTHDKDPQTVFTATAGGFFISFDQGKTFEKRWSKRQTYQRATLSVSGEIYLTSVSNGPSGSRSKLYLTQDVGLKWEEVEGLPKITDNINTYQITKDNHNHVYVIINNNELYKSEDYGQTWSLELEGMPKTYQVLMK